MNRRLFVKTLSAGTVGSLALAKSAEALLSCTPFNVQGVQQCEAGINSNLADVVAGSTDGQHMNQWCWAACIEMVFRYYGYMVPQERIVAETWGGIVNMPAGPMQILANLNRPWIDNNGKRFGVMGDSYSANPITASQDLSQNMPLIIGTMGHAMVLSSLTYLRNQLGQGEVTAAIVRDPWPRPDTQGSHGRRMLTSQEWYSTNFLARIRVSPI